MWRSIAAVALSLFTSCCSSAFSEAQRPAAPLIGQDALAAFRLRIARQWTPPRDAETVVLRIKLNEDGTLAGPPIVLTSAEGKSPQFAVARDAAVRAIYKSAPFNMLPKDKYEAWKDIEIRMDSTTLAR